MGGVLRDAPSGRPLAPQLAPNAPQAAATILQVAQALDEDAPSNLPSEHPAWARDRLALSLRAREIVERLRPIVVRALGQWDHRARSIDIAGRRLCIDASGCYRLS